MEDFQVQEPIQVIFGSDPLEIVIHLLPWLGWTLLLYVNKDLQWP